MTRIPLPFFILSEAYLRLPQDLHPLFSLMSSTTSSPSRSLPSLVIVGVCGGAVDNSVLTWREVSSSARVPETPSSRHWCVCSCRSCWVSPSGSSLSVPAASTVVGGFRRRKDRQKSLHAVSCSVSLGGCIEPQRIAASDSQTATTVTSDHGIGDGEGCKNIRVAHGLKEKEQGNKSTFRRTLRIVLEDGGRRKVQWVLERQATEEAPKKCVVARPLTTVARVPMQAKHDGRLLCWVPRAQSQNDIVVLGDVRGAELAGMDEKATKVGESAPKGAPCKEKAKMEAHENSIVTLRDPSSSGVIKRLEPETDSSSSEAEEGEFFDEASIISFFDNEEGLLIEQLEKKYEEQERDQKRRLDDGLEGVASLLEMGGSEGNVTAPFFLTWHARMSIKDAQNAIIECPDTSISGLLTILQETIMKDAFCGNEEISLALIKPLLESVRKENETISPPSWALGEKVIRNCAIQLKPYLMQAVQSSGRDLNDYAQDEVPIFSFKV
ncbi:sister chromatid cohesion PDS5-like protein [Senna tora]|uniref:Sister chromatid cohesion PDS5-like protein n=1 Tax=Senna tora TaxID=362788 RepID=A0A834T2D4_9FABA|nr:sister chromatid cohesion PDS5-like protein [Senna tora]